MRFGHDGYRILQIMPAVGYHLEWDTEDGAQRTNVIAWALAEQLLIENDDDGFGFIAKPSMGNAADRVSQQVLPLVLDEGQFVRLTDDAMLLSKVDWFICADEPKSHKVIIANSDDVLP